MLDLLGEQVVLALVHDRVSLGLLSLAELVDNETVLHVVVQELLLAVSKVIHVEL